MQQRTTDRNEMLLDAGLALASELSLEAVLRRIVELAAELTGARYGALGVLGPDGGISEFITVGVTEDQRARIGHPPLGRGILGVLIEKQQPLRLREISEDPRSVGFPPNHPGMHSFLGAPVKARGRVYGNIYLTEKQGAEEFSEDDERALLALAAQAGVAVQNAHLMEEARQRASVLEAVRDISLMILEDDEPATILEVIAARARELAHADVATIAAPDPEDDEALRLEVAVGRYAERVRRQRFARRGSISGEVLADGRPAILPDASKDERSHQPVVALGEIGPAMFVPLTLQGRPFGTLTVANSLGGRQFSEEDLALVETFATQASVALEYGRAQGELKRLAVMEDRERIAKELHDGVIQSLFAVGMGLQATAALSPDPELEARIEAAVEEVDRVIRDLRNYIFGLRPGILADRQLDQALRRLGEEFEARSRVTTVVEIDARVAAELSSKAQDLLQLAREALSNVGRHAEATTCRVSLRRLGESAVLEIDDDGRGFDVQARATAGQGLGNLRARAEALGGSVSISSTAGEGTTVRATIPL